jgi:hypothetical protein
MVEVPSGFISLWPPGTGAKILRAWAGGYGTQYGFTRPRQGQSEGFEETQGQDAFRHAFVASAIYLEAYNTYKNIQGQPHDLADRRATAKALGLGNMNELWGTNPLARHLKDYWNNYEGVSLAREIAAQVGVDIPNDRLAQIVAGQINASIQAPIGKSRFILFDHNPNSAVSIKDPRLDVDRYDTNRLPNEGWGIGPFPGAEGYARPSFKGSPSFIKASPKHLRRAPKANRSRPPQPLLRRFRIRQAQRSRAAAGPILARPAIRPASPWPERGRPVLYRRDRGSPARRSRPARPRRRACPST